MKLKSKSQSNLVLPKVKPFLKWPGGKYQIIDKIFAALPPGKKLIEPFLGSGVVFLNADYNKFTLNDINYDLINLYNNLNTYGKEFISFCKTYFKPKYNNSSMYYKLRKKFNKIERIDFNEERAAIFLYLNRHGFNGLCRYNKSKQEYNVPFGSYIKPYFPEQQMLYFLEKSSKAKFYCEDFQKTMHRARPGDVVYCDPPYAPIEQKSNYTSYVPGGFDLDNQIRLVELAEKLSNRGVHVVLSNHYTKFTREIYANAKLYKFEVQRNISCDGKNRKKITEVLAVFKAVLPK